MSIEQEIWDEFKQLSEQDIDDGITYRKAKAHFGIKYEDTLSSVNYVSGSQSIRNDVDFQIDKALKNGDKVDWDEIVKLYPPSPVPIELLKAPKKPVKFRSHKERLEIGSALDINWEGDKQRLHSMFPTEETCVNHLGSLRWEGNPFCPFISCGHAKVYSFSDGRRYKCAKCRKIFSVTVGTIFENSKVPLKKWFGAMYLLTSIKTRKISTCQLAKALDITQKTSWGLVKKIQSKVEDKFLSDIKYGLFESKGAE